MSFADQIKAKLSVSHVVIIVLAILLANAQWVHIGGMGMGGGDNSALNEQITTLTTQRDYAQNGWNTANETIAKGSAGGALCDCNASIEEANKLEEKLKKCQNETGGDSGDNALADVLDGIAGYDTISKKSFSENIDNSAGLKYPNIKLGSGTPKFFSLANGDTQAILDAVPEGMGDQEALRYIQSTLEGQFTENDVPTVFTSYETKDSVQIIKRIFFLEEAQEEGEDAWYRAYFTEDGKTKNSVTVDEDNDSAYRVRNFD